LSTADARTRSSLIADRQRANTASPMSVSGTPSFSASTTAHLPVPFCPAVSSILSISGVPSSSFVFKILAVISIR